jgi:hypothetical protein
MLSTGLAMRDLTVIRNTWEGTLNLFKTRADTKHQEKTAPKDCPDHLSHEPELADFYQKYEGEGVAATEGHNHPLNLFDDSDVKDKYWFNIAKRHLRNM